MHALTSSASSRRQTKLTEQAGQLDRLAAGDGLLTTKGMLLSTDAIVLLKQDHQEIKKVFRDFRPLERMRRSRRVIWSRR